MSDGHALIRGPKGFQCECGARLASYPGQGQPLAAHRAHRALLKLPVTWRKPADTNGPNDPADPPATLF